MRRQRDGRLECLSHILKRTDKVFELRALLKHISRNSPHLSGMSYDFGGQLADSGQHFLIGCHFSSKFLSSGLRGIAFSQRGLELLCDKVPTLDERRVRNALGTDALSSRAEVAFNRAARRRSACR